MVTHDISKLRKGMRVLTMSDGVIAGDSMFDGVDPTVYDKFGLANEEII